ncbi:glycosyltransferase family 2 protein [Nanoarchaeota archaeon]
MKECNISVIVPVYNEEKAVQQTISNIKKILDKTNNKYEIIAVNDGSTDKSLKILNKISQIKVLNNQENKGYGASLKKGIHASKGKWILIIDADGTYPTKSIPDLLKHTRDYDMVVGSRTGKNVKVPFLRRPAKFILGALANFLTSKKIPDLNSGLRIFKRIIAEEFMHLFPEGFSFTTTITLASLTSGYDVKYVPIDYRKRIGKSSISPFHFFEFTSLILRMVMYFKPLKFFLVPGLLFFILGMGYFIYQAFWFSNISDLSIIFILGGMQICFIGLIADLIVKKIRR